MRSSIGSGARTIVSCQVVTEESSSKRLTVALDVVPLLHGALFLGPFLEPGDIFGVDHSPAQDEACLFQRVLGCPLAHRLDHEHVLGCLDVLGVEVPLFELSLVLLFSAHLSVELMRVRWCLR